MRTSESLADAPARRSFSFYGADSRETVFIGFSKSAKGVLAALCTPDNVLGYALAKLVIFSDRAPPTYRDLKRLSYLQGFEACGPSGTTDISGLPQVSTRVWKRSRSGVGNPTPSYGLPP